MLKNVLSDKMDDPTAEPIGINTLFCKAELTRKPRKCWVSSAWFSAIWKACHSGKKQPCVYFQHCSVLGMLEPSSLCIHELLLWLPLFPYRVGAKNASQRGTEYEIFTAFSLIRTDGHAGVCTYRSKRCRLIHIRRDSGRRKGVKIQLHFTNLR